MSNRSNYRVKVDLTKYHQDARRFSWIYIDSTNVWFISHVKQHIANIFGTEEPFHLLLNGKEYLPPNEDVRILKENELITVLPGTGINNTTDLTMRSPGRHHSTVNNTVQPIDKNNLDHQSKKCKQLNNPEGVDDKFRDDSIADISAINATTYHSVWDKTEMEKSPNVKMTDENSINQCSTMDQDGPPIHKRKRIRRKRSKHAMEESFEEPKNAKVHNVILSKKPLHLPVIPAGKHIHFDNADERVSAPLENGANEGSIDNEKRKLSSSSASTVISKNTVANLSTLLSLRQTSTPLTFVNKKLKHMSSKNSEEITKNHDCKMENSASPKDTQLIQESNGQNNINVISENSTDYSNVDPEKYPNLENVTELNDIIAFKILKIGNEYTPEVSDYIIAKTISWCAKKLLYTFQILKGQTEIQTPLGKFSLPTDESEEQICDTANFNFSQLIDPRLIYRK